MSLETDLQYDPATFAGPFDEAKLRAFERWLQKCQSPQIQFDANYIEHLRRFHGGVPVRRYFETAAGTAHVITRFLNFTVKDRKNPLSKYRVESTWGLIEDRLGTFLIPFAELFGGDFLCFDHAGAGPPGIVVWFHDRSRERNPYTEVVAKDFPGFLSVLRMKGHK